VKEILYSPPGGPAALDKKPAPATLKSSFEVSRCAWQGMGGGGARGRRVQAVDWQRRGGSDGSLSGKTPRRRRRTRRRQGLRARWVAPDSRGASGGTPCGQRRR
jgi:hypothetical protein